MPGRYRINASFGLDTEVEPEGIRFRPDGGTFEFSDESSYSRSSVSVDGGRITFEIEADSEDDAETQARDTIFEGMEVDDSLGFTWEVEGLEIEVEELTPPMDRDRAVSVVTAFLGTVANLTDEQREAFQFLLDFIMARLPSDPA